ncbi:MAG: hypothetical protein HDR41_04235 [Lactobacillus sp.]|nr:hypothetical protein [Lactobacillus sp.]
MKRRIRKKKLKLRLYHIDRALIHNSELEKKYKKGKTIYKFMAGFVLPMSSIGLKIQRNILQNKLKNGDY